MHTYFIIISTYLSKIQLIDIFHKSLSTVVFLLSSEDKPMFLGTENTIYLRTPAVAGNSDRWTLRALINTT